VIDPDRAAGPGSASEPEPQLLAVDLGVRCGLAVLGADGRLRTYRSRNFGSVARMRRGARSIVESVDGLQWVVAEGDANLARPWFRAAERRGAHVRRIGAEVWRERLLRERDLLSAVDLKSVSILLAARFIEWSGAPAPRAPMRHDAAEAIAVGLWAALELGWLSADALSEIARQSGP
jgi:hypothetical protein